MTVERDVDGSIRLSGACPQEDAEPLLRLVSDDPTAIVDWRGCERAHTAVIQILLAAGSELLGPPKGEFLKEHLAPLLAARETGAPASPAPKQKRVSKST